MTGCRPPTSTFTEATAARSSLPLGSPQTSRESPPQLRLGADAHADMEWCSGPAAEQGHETDGFFMR